MKTFSFAKLALNTFTPLALWAAMVPAIALDLGGVTHPRVLQTGATSLQLNGAGVRQHSGSGLYTAGLYLDQKLATPDSVLGNPGAKQLRVVMLKDISASDMGDLLARGMQASASDAQLATLIPALFRLGEILGEQKKLAAGDSFQIAWQPGQGTVISINGKQRGEAFPQPALFEALLGMWVGPKPADEQLKSALLGRAI